MSDGEPLKDAIVGLPGEDSHSYRLCFVHNQALGIEGEGKRLFEEVAMS